MIPIPVFWTKYTVKMRGTSLKTVLCENCSTEYVYVIQREGTGVGTSVYLLNEDGAAAHAGSAAHETLQAVLENDFDPVPCPVCGHYQRDMFPKLLEAQGITWVDPVLLLVVVISCLNTVIALYCSVSYLLSPNPYDLRKMFTAWSFLLALCLVAFGLWLVKQRKIRRFDPNREDQQARIATGRSRAITKAEFEWGLMKQRRVELLRKKHRQGLTPQEQSEYERLQRLSHEALGAEFPQHGGESDGRDAGAS
jgi:hypothetical protein